MKILFLTNRLPTANDHSCLEKELVSVFARNGHECFVANLLERKYNTASHIQNLEIAADTHIKLLQIKVGNMFNDVSFLEKKFSVLLLSYLIPKAIKLFFKDHHFDLIIAYGPYLSSASIVKPLKDFFNCKAALIQWDIFPQNAQDLGIINNKLILKYLQYHQRSMLVMYDLILCNSQGNIEYFKNHFAQETQNKLFLFKNCETLLDITQADSRKLSQSNTQHTAQVILKTDPATLLFGGNIGIPQKLENILSIADRLSEYKNINFIISGQGTQAPKIKQLCQNRTNVQFIDFLPRAEYENLLQNCSMGIVSLNEKFTVPNFPAKVTSYLKLGIPIFACLDDASYNDLGQFINKHNIGFAVKASEIKTHHSIIAEQLLNILTDNNKLTQMRINAKATFNHHFNIDTKYQELMEHISEILD